MDRKSSGDRICELIEEHFDWKPAASLLGSRPPFDISRPNIHDNKSDFLLERDTVQAVVNHLDSVFSLLLKTGSDEPPEHKEMMDRLGVAVSINALQLVQRISPRSASDLARKNVVDAGWRCCVFAAAAY